MQLIHCSHAESFWTEARSWLDVKLPELHRTTWSSDILCDPFFAEENRAKIIIVMWAIWSSRNNVVHDKGNLNPTHSMRMTRDALAFLDIP
jgi:hypothetical protein